MGMFDSPLCILTWKHMKERKRRVCYTIWEITSGVLMFVMLLLMRQVIKYSYSAQSVQTTEDSLDDIFFAPDFITMNNFMLNVTNKLSRRYDSDQTAPCQIRGFFNEEALRKYVQAMNTSRRSAIVIFKDDDDLSTLNYKIGLINTRVSNDVLKPNLRTGFIVESLHTQEPASWPLMKLQWAIDQTFMELVTGSNITHTVVVPTLQQNAEVKSPMTIVHRFLILCTVAAPIPFFLYNSSRLGDERQSGLKELMKIVGVSPNVLRLSHLVDTAILSMVYAALITLMLKVTSTPILPKSDALLIAMTIILHFLNVTSLAFFTSALSDSYEHANIIALVIYVTSSMLCSIWHSNFHKTIQVYIFCWFLPHAPVYMFWDEVIYMEQYGSGATFSDIVTRHHDTSVPILMCWVCFLVQLLIIMGLSWYMDLVKPGVYGVARKWNFLCKKEYWARKKKVTFHVTVEQTRRLLRDDRFFENGPRAHIAIKLIKVTKVFHGGTQHKVIALDHVSLDVYQGEITVILGVDGSGKTTLTSIVTGIMAATKGRVYVNGFDNKHRLEEIRRDLGWCPQHNLTFDYLTVRENIYFFEKLRGSKREARSSVERLLIQMHLQDKADFFIKELSANEERCLQVACALAGGADVLVLDEPTSSCDADTRHYLWDAILALRGHKTILMTTNSIEEADVLGDRVALLSHGKLRCFGTPLFLKNAIGSGFNLSVTLRHKKNVEAVQQVIEDMLPDAITTPIDRKRVLFTLPAKDHEKFPTLFDTLEERKDKLGIAAMGVGMSLEEMFLGFIDDEEDADALFVKTFHGAQKLYGCRLRCQQMRTLMKRNFLYMWSRKYQFMILQFLVPVLGLVVITLMSNTHGGVDSSGVLEIPVNPSVTLLFSSPSERSDQTERLKLIHPGVHVLRSRNVSGDFWSSDKDHNSDNKKVIGIKMEEDQSYIYYPIESQLDALKAINIFSNSYMALRTQYDGVPIRTNGTNDIAHLFIPKEMILCTLWSMWASFLVTLPLTPFIRMLICEFKADIHYAHSVVGCPIILHWLAKLACHGIVFMLIIPPSVVISAKFLDYEHTLSQDEFLVGLFITLMLFLPAFLLQLYVLSFFLNERSAVTQITITCFAMGFSGPLTQLLLVQLSHVSDWYTYPMQFFSFIGWFSPVFTLSELTAYMATTASIKTYCSHNARYCNRLILDDWRSKMLYEICCDPKREIVKYINKEATIETVTMVAIIIGSTVVLVAVQKRWVQHFFHWLCYRNYNAIQPMIKDLRVYQEMLSVRRMMNCLRKPDVCIGERPSDKVLLVEELHKKFLNVCQKSRRVNAVRGISFHVDPGESLILLGHSDSGKTSTLLMIAGIMPMTRGDCHVGGRFLKKQRSKYMKNVAFINGGLDGFFTGYENVKTLCLLHGYHRRHAETFSINFISYLGLQNLAHSKVNSYSPSCSRRLALTAALLAKPLVVLLDDPMHAVDPHARPVVTRALDRLRSDGSTLVWTGHSLDWRDLESQSTCIAILTEGRLVALGPSTEVRKMLADGHTARLKLKVKPIHNYDDSNVEISLEDVSVGERPTRIKSGQHRVRSSAMSELALSEDEDEDKETNKKKKYPKSAHFLKNSSRNEDADSNEASSSHASTGVSEKHLRTQRRHYWTSTDERNVHERDDILNDEIDDDSEFKRKKYRKDDYRWFKEKRDRKEVNDDSLGEDATSSAAAGGALTINDEEQNSQQEAVTSATKMVLPDTNDKQNDRSQVEKQVNKTPPGGSFKKILKKDPQFKVYEDNTSRQSHLTTLTDIIGRVAATIYPSSLVTLFRRLIFGTRRGPHYLRDGTAVVDHATSRNAETIEIDFQKDAEDKSNLDENKQLEKALNENDSHKNELIEVHKAQEVYTPDRMSLIGFLNKKEITGPSYADLARENKNRSVISLDRVEGLKADFKRQFPTSELVDEHLSLLIFHIHGDQPMPYSMMFSKLELLKNTYADIVEDFTLSEISIDEIYCLIAKEKV